MKNFQKDFNMNKSNFAHRDKTIVSYLGKCLRGLLKYTQSSSRYNFFTVNRFARNFDHCGFLENHFTVFFSPSLNGTLTS